jgi:hypothetical protein
VEVGYQRYRELDRGPTLQMSRWFGDVEAQIFLRKGEQETRIGFGLVLPLTPRVGMKPGLAQLEGSNAYGFRLETKYARPGECNCITPGVLEEVPMVYSARQHLFNRGRFSQAYFVSQLPRMRLAYLELYEAKDGK